MTSNERQKPLNVDLRTKIACVLAGITTNNTPKQEYLEMADEVIRETGLRKETKFPGVITSTTLPRHRYVTEWKTDE